MTSSRGPAKTSSFNGIEFGRGLPVQFGLRGAALRMQIVPTAADLLEVALGILLADRLVRRTRGSPRFIPLRLRVRKPQLWHGLAGELEDLLLTLTGDQFQLSFQEGKSKHFVTPQTEGVQTPALDRVLLFSGGLDSSVGAARFASHGGNTGFVTQYVGGIQFAESLLNDINRAYSRGGWPEHACFFVRPFGPSVRLMRENSRRSRSFLFLALATAFAIGRGAKEVFVCENGPLALNLPLSPAMVPTRHAHGEFLVKMNRLCEKLFGCQMKIANPFELSTKGEMAKIFKPHPDLALRTLSCWYQQWSGSAMSYGRGHCGHCLPCVIRRVSLQAADIKMPSNHFDWDIVRLGNKARKSEKERQMIGPWLLLVEFARRIAACSNWRQFVQSFPEALDQVPTYHDLTSHEWYCGLFRMMRRFAEEVLAMNDRGGRK